MPVYFFVKSFFDRVIAFIALCFLLPFLLPLACLIRLRLGSPVLFFQERPGFNASPFRLVKFRSMIDSFGPDGNPLSDSQRITPFGFWLRSTSLDELPELWNILCGDMSFVGPRPLLMKYLPLYDSQQFRRHSVLPGLTGLAQVSGRNAISWEAKFRLDVLYVDRQSLLLDLRILLITVWKVLSRQGINAAGEVTTLPFTGRQENQ